LGSIVEIMVATAGPSQELHEIGTKIYIIGNVYYDTRTTVSSREIHHNSTLASDHESITRYFSPSLFLVL
jgi:hypothetical protein